MLRVQGTCKVLALNGHMSLHLRHLIFGRFEVDCQNNTNCAIGQTFVKEDCLTVAKEE